MKICFFSDVHGNKYTFYEFIKQITQQQIDYCVFGGDVLGYYYDSDEIIDYLRRSSIRCLLGNHDQMFLDVLSGKRKEEDLVQKYGNSYQGIVKKIKEKNVAFLRSLSSEYEMNVGGFRIGFFHGGPASPINQRIYPDTNLEEIEELQNYDFIFVGHTHHKMVKKIKRCTVINPGSLGQQRDGKGCSYVIFDTDSKEIQYIIVSYDREKLVKDIDRNQQDIHMNQKLKEVLYREREWDDSLGKMTF